MVVVPRRSRHRRVRGQLVTTMPSSKGRAGKASACPATCSTRSEPIAAVSTDHGFTTGTTRRTCWT
eukprot:8048729-Lingulodinium_polyedra.AAC.1